MPLPRQETYTFADLLSWEGPERYELVQGVPCLLAAPKRIHQEVLGGIYRQIGDYLEGKTCKAYVLPFAVRLFADAQTSREETDTVVEPDISVVCDQNKLDDYGCAGAPDLVIEVVSQSTQQRDRFTKYHLYEKAGVREYWIADPISKIVQVYLLENGRYENIGVYTQTDIVRVNVLKSCFVELSRVFTE